MLRLTCLQNQASHCRRRPRCRRQRGEYDTVLAWGVVYSMRKAVAPPKDILHRVPMRSD